MEFRGGKDSKIRTKMTCVTRFENNGENVDFQSKLARNYYVPKYKYLSF